MSDPASIGELIRRARLEAGVSQASLARRAGTSQAAVSRIERGLEQPGFERVDALLASLGLRYPLTVVPLAVHDAEPRRLIQQTKKPMQERFEEGLDWDDFMRSIDSAATRAHGRRA